ncbi:MAG: RlmE family RNA methyltransferase [Planctomycetota bacterium]
MPRRVLHDKYFKQAKAEGYVARSAFKLIEIQRRFDLLRAHDRVLDVGCAPGSWLQVVSGIVGDHGRVVGIDLKPVRHPMPPNVATVVGDATSHDVHELACLASPLEPKDSAEPEPKPEPKPEPFDAVLSDMAPNTTGHGDDLVSARLCQDVLGIAARVLRPGGRLVMKILEGSAYNGVFDETRACFRRVKGFRPRSTREVSREIFIVAAGFKGATGPAPAGRAPEPVEGWSS